ncbi:hypothetical protein CB1_000526017 [Camelus ferus]|nr:hypothetical protein CB1_000526017 [Camelus ferus]
MWQLLPLQPRAGEAEVVGVGSEEMLRAPRQPLTADLGVCKEGSTAELGTLTEVTHGSKGAARSCWKDPQEKQSSSRS